jgi:predicted GNAT superfamily acetyltransferase
VVQAASLALAAAWRASTRAALVPALARGYRVVGFARDGGAERSHYVLARTPETDRLG